MSKSLAPAGAFSKFMAEHCMNIDEPWTKAAYTTYDTLFLAKLICKELFDTESPDPVDVLTVFKSMLQVERTLRREDEP